MIHENRGPLPAVTVDIAEPGTPLQLVSAIELAQEGEGVLSSAKASQGHNVRHLLLWIEQRIAVRSIALFCL